VKNPRAFVVAPLLLILALFATACVGTENPEGWAAPVFDGNTVYFLQSHDRLAAAPLTATDTSTKITWSFPDKARTEDKDVSLKAVYGEPVVEGDHLYFSSYSGGVFALNTADGRPVWRMKDEIEGNVVGGVAVSGNVLAFGTTEGHLYVVNTADKSPAPGWTASGVHYSEGIWATPIIKGDTLYVATMGGDLHALDIKTGAEKWDKPFHASGAIADFNFASDTQLIVPSLNKHVYLLNPADGSVRGDFVASDWVWTQPKYKDGKAYFGDFSGKAYAVDITTMKADWTATLGDTRVKSAAAIVDNVVMIGDRKPVVHFLDASAGGKELNAVPLLNDGTLRADITEKDGFGYISTTNGKLLRANPKDKSVNEIIVGGRQ
jgi:outer membrane protein assembly factor BamB